MKSIADIKRTMKEGTRWHCYNHRYERDMGIRKVGKTNTVNFAFLKNTGTEEKSIWQLSYCSWPSLNEVEFHGDGFTISRNMAYDNEEPDFQKVLTYTLIK